jgi:hypothetical protein
MQASTPILGRERDDVAWASVLTLDSDRGETPRATL